MRAFGLHGETGLIPAAWSPFSVLDDHDEKPAKPYKEDRAIKHKQQCYKLQQYSQNAGDRSLVHYHEAHDRDEHGDGQEELVYGQPTAPDDHPIGMLDTYASAVHRRK
jgi:hypothetical protein